jgi:hypothetical protein
VVRGVRPSMKGTLLLGDTGVAEGPAMQFVRAI